MGSKSFVERQATHYCYLDGSSAVFLNRWDQIIKRFDNYTEAHNYAKENIHLINEPKKTN